MRNSSTALYLACSRSFPGSRTQVGRSPPTRVFDFSQDNRSGTETRNPRIPSRRLNSSTDRRRSRRPVERCTDIQPNQTQPRQKRHRFSPLVSNARFAHAPALGLPPREHNSFFSHCAAKRGGIIWTRLSDLDRQFTNHIFLLTSTQQICYQISPLEDFR
jgi:hypothetical protein